MPPFLTIQRQRSIKFRVLGTEDFYAPLGLKCQKGHHLPALDVYKNQSPRRLGGAALVKTSTGNNFPRKYQRIPRHYCQYWCYMLAMPLPFSAVLIIFKSSIFLTVGGLLLTAKCFVCNGVWELLCLQLELFCLQLELFSV